LHEKHAIPFSLPDDLAAAAGLARVAGTRPGVRCRAGGHPRLEAVRVRTRDIRVRSAARASLFTCLVSLSRNAEQPPPRATARFSPAAGSGTAIDDTAAVALSAARVAAVLAW